MYNEDLYENSLCHFGTLGMKWGIRKYQNKDGSLTPEGKLRYGSGKDKKVKNSKTLTKEEQEKIAKRKRNLAIAGGAVLTGAAVYAGLTYLENKKLKDKYVRDILTGYGDSYTKNRDAREIISLYENHPFNFQKEYHNKTIKQRVRSKLEKEYQLASREHEKNPTKENKAKLKIAANKYLDGTRNMSNRDLKNWEKNNKRSPRASEVLSRISTPSKANKSTVENLLNQNSLSKLNTESKKTRKSLADELFNKYSPMGPQRTKGLKELVKATGLSGSELEEQGLIKLSGKEIADFKKYHPELWK